jgi:hypothetical protein
VTRGPKSARDVLERSQLRFLAAMARWIKNGFDDELVVVKCRVCQRPIATTDVDRARGWPPFGLELKDEHEPQRWRCYDCAKCPTCGFIVGCRCEAPKTTAQESVA